MCSEDFTEISFHFPALTAAFNFYVPVSGHDAK